MNEMGPPWVRSRVTLLYRTGILQWAIGVALRIPGTRRWTCIAALILFLPVNVYAAENRIGMGGPLWGSVYLFVRVPLQMLLIGWAYWFVARRQSS